MSQSVSLIGELAPALAALATAIGGVISGLLVQRTKVLAAKERAAEDRAELRRVLEERDDCIDEARVDEMRRTQDAQRIARLESENAYLKHELRKILRAVPPSTRAIIDTNFGELGPPEEPKR